MSLTLNVIAFMMLAISTQAIAQYQYRLVDLQAGAERTAYSINDAGQIAGGARNAFDSSNHFFIWQDGSIQFINPPPGYTDIMIYGISPSGAVVGNALNCCPTGKAFIYMSGFHLFPPLQGGTEARAWTANSFNHVVGYSTHTSGNAAVVWLGDSVINLGELGGHSSFAFDINDFDDIVGQSMTSTGATHATLFSGGKVTDLGVLPTYNYSEARSINNKGWVVGSSLKYSPYLTNAFQWNAISGMVNIGDSSYANAINDSGIVVGGTSDRAIAKGRAFVWKNNIRTDLNQITDRPPGWIIYDALDINNKGQIVGTAMVGTSSRAILLNPLIMTVIHPDSDEVVIADQPSMIEWNSLGIDTIKIEVSLDEGASYQIITDRTPTRGNFYQWMAPDTFSAKCNIRLTDVRDSTNRAVSKTFKIKGYRLTRQKPDGNYEAFRPDLHGWSFGNEEDNMWPQSWWSRFDYSNGIDPFTGSVYPPYFTSHPMRAKSQDFLDWPLLVKAYDTTQCYLRGGQLRYNFYALDFWRAMKSPWGGSCYGFAVSSLMAFDNQGAFSALFPEVGAFTNLYELPLSDARRRVINQLFSHQFSYERLLYYQTVWAKTPRQTLQDLKEKFLSDVRDDWTLSLIDSASSAGHEVVPYRLQRFDDEGRYYLYVYDNNCPGGPCPGQGDPIIGIDSAQNTWYYNMLDWGGFRGLYLDSPVSLSFYRPGMIVLSEMFISSPSKASITITDSSGHSIGFQDSVVSGTMPGGFPIIPATSRFHPPLGYYVPEGTYTVHLNNFTDSLAALSTFTDSRVIDYCRSDADSNQSDELSLRDGIDLGSHDSQPKRVNLGAIVRQDSTAERRLQILNCQIVQNDSLQLKTPVYYRLSFVNRGQQKLYDLQIELSTISASGRFEHTDVSVAANTSHLVVPNWQNLEQPVKILIDNGNDGTIDDSMTVTNELTGIDEKGITEIPAEFELEQNFPNPFNPSTTISFRLPQKSFVSLKIFDILGREIATLVSAELSAGKHSRIWTATGITGGVYLYRLVAEAIPSGQAGSFVETKKLILMK